jgi:tetratricopeptide (TPR) repeat protein
VAGPVFWDQALAALDVLAVAGLAELVTRELIRPHDESRLAGADEYAFRHHSLHRVAYDSVLKRVKRTAHASLARWLAAQPAADALQDEIAEHHERGGERERARDAWHRAAEHARLRFANAQALAHAERALALTDEHELPRRLALTLLRLRVLQTVTDRPRMADTLAAMEVLADSAGDDGWRSEAAEWRAKLEFHCGNAQAALESAQRAAALAPADDFERQARAHCQRSYALERLGRYEEAQPAFEAALRLARAAGQAELEATIVNHQGIWEIGRGDWLAAVAHFNQALAIHRHEGHLANTAGTLANLAFAAMSVGDFEQAKAQFEEAREFSARVGHQQNVGIIEINLGLVLLHLAQPDEAWRRAHHALELVRAIGDRWAEAAALRVGGQTELALGRQEAARAHLVAARDLFDELKMGHLAMEAIAVMVEEALSRGDTAGALVHAQDINARREKGASIDGADEPMRIPLAVWRALHAAGDAGAAAALADAQRELQSRADRLCDPALRQRFLTAVAQHREIMAAVARA